MKNRELQLVHNVERTEEEIQKGSQGISNSGFNSGCLAEALENKEDIYRQFHVSGSPNVDDMVRLTKIYILNILEEDSATIDLKHVQPQFFTQWKKRLQASDEPRTIIEEISQSLHDIAYRVMTREQLEEELQRKCSVKIMNEDVTRLLVHEINSRHRTPRILGLKNKRKPYNPLYVRADAPEPLSTEAQDILRHFDH